MKKTKRQQRIDGLAAFAKATSALVESLGGRRIRSPYVPDDSEWAELVLDDGAWELETRFGTLRISAFGNWTACRFLEPERPAKFLDTGYSGKWNFHWHRERQNPRTKEPLLAPDLSCLDELRQRLEAILPEVTVEVRA